MLKFVYYYCEYKRDEYVPNMITFMFWVAVALFSY